MSKVGVTGGSGFIGRYVCEQLTTWGYEPVVLDTHKTKRYDSYYGDITDSKLVTEFAAHVDGIIHLAACLGTAETINNPWPAAQVNIHGSLNVFEACVQYDLPCVYIAVGNHQMAKEGGGTYTISKTCAEDFTRMYNKHRGAKINVVRAMNAFGPRQLAATPFGPGKVRKIAPAFICRALSGQPIEIYGDGTQISDMVAVEDVAELLVLAWESAFDGDIFSRAVEAGPQESLTVNDIAHMVAGEASKYTGSEVSLKHLPMRPGETPNAVVSADTSTLALVGRNYGDLITLEDQIAKTVKWFWKKKGKTWQ